jgi:cytochrome c-type biogenesis protein CcsB
MIGYLVSNASDLVARIATSEYPKFGQWIATQMQLAVDPTQYAQLAENWLRLNGSTLAVGFKSNPIEFSALLALFVGLALTGLFAWKREVVTSSLPSLDTLDLLLYRSVGVVFPLLTLVLVTGAVWANESWGRYWGWDPKEVGALVAWLAYAGYLHARITHGWTGRRSAYFALVGFALVVFTWLGVSFLLPGLHSYA